MTPPGQRRGSSVQRPKRSGSLSFQVDSTDDHGLEGQRTLERPEDGSYLALIDWSPEAPVGGMGQVQGVV